MEIEIFGVPSCINTEKRWQLVINYFDLDDKETPLTKTKPLPEIPMLPIGVEILDDLTLGISAGASKEISFSNFSNGKIISIEDLPNKLYPFDVPKEVLNDTKLYSVSNGSPKPYVFFCYELFRTFLCQDNRIIPYLFQYDVLESYINKSEIREEGEKRYLNLELNDDFPKSFLKDKKFLKKYLFLLYNKSMREYWKSIQANSTTIKSDFSFNAFGINKLDLECRVKEYKDFSLIYYIEKIRSKFEFPFDRLDLVHASFKDHNKKNQSKGSGKKGSFNVELPSNHSTDDNQSGSSKSTESISILPLNFTFDREMEIRRINLPSSDNSSNPNSKRSFPKLKIKDLNLGFNNFDKGEGNDSLFLNLTRDEGFYNFDYSKIPSGLVSFSKVVHLLTSTLNLGFSYEIKQFSNDSIFSKINNSTRKALIISIHHSPPVYIIEIDSSDDKFISTLMITNVCTDKKDDFLDMVLEKAGDKYGVWPDEYIDIYSEFEKIKHPNKTKRLESLPEKDKYEIYIDRMTLKLIKILV